MERAALAHSENLEEAALHLELESTAGLPPLSWCARVRKGGAVNVRHGAGIETRPDRFVEGAWDGDFETFDFDGAKHLAGSGGVVGDGRCVFAAPFHPLEWLYVLEGDAETLVSNSLVFLLNEAGDGPVIVTAAEHPRTHLVRMRDAMERRSVQRADVGRRKRDVACPQAELRGRAA